MEEAGSITVSEQVRLPSRIVMEGWIIMGCSSYLLLLSAVLHIAHTNTVSLWASGAVAPILDLKTLKEQHREQKLTPQLVQYLLFFSTENAAAQLEQFPVGLVGTRLRSFSVSLDTLLRIGSFLLSRPLSDTES